MVAKNMCYYGEIQPDDEPEMFEEYKLITLTEIRSHSSETIKLIISLNLKKYFACQREKSKCYNFM